MRKSPDIAPRICIICGDIYKPKARTQKYCPNCAIKADKERKQKWVLKTYPNRKPKKKTEEVCCVCGGTFSSHYGDLPYCNKHYQKMHLYGSLEPRIRKSTNKFIFKNDCLEIVTAHGDKIITDISDYEKVSKHSWCMRGGYAVANINNKVTSLHRYLMCPENGMVVDHKNGDTSDNRRANLRVCTPRENFKNQRGNKNRELPIGIRTTKYGKFEARICHNRKTIRLGNYDSLEEAIQARENAEIMYCGEFAQHLSRGGRDDAQ